MFLALHQPPVEPPAVEQMEQDLESREDIEMPQLEALEIGNESDAMQPLSVGETEEGSDTAVAESEASGQPLLVEEDDENSDNALGAALQCLTAFALAAFDIVGWLAITLFVIILIVAGALSIGTAFVIVWAFVALFTLCTYCFGPPDY